MITCIQLIVTFMKIGLFSFGGGYAMISLMQRETIVVNQWLSETEFIDILAISQATPGPIAINLATFLGYKVAGIAGSIAATLAVVFPSFILLSVVFVFLKKYRQSKAIGYFFQGIRPMVIGLIGASFLSIFLTSVDSLIAGIFFVVCFYLVTFQKLHPILVLILAGFAGIVLM